MKKNEKVLLQSSQVLICSMMKERNVGTEGCLTTTRLAREIGIPREYLAEYLVSQNLLRKVRFHKQASQKAIELGYAMIKVRFEYSSTGHLKEVAFPVWTPDGVDFIKRKLRLKK